MARVLIVEDERPLQRIITLNLVRRGYTVAEADSVASADETLAAWKYAFDVILLDINLPDQTGWDLLRHLAKALAPATGQDGTMPHVIVMTAVRPAQSRIDEFHPDAVLVKPFPIQALVRLIERVLASTPSQQETAEGEETDDAFTDSSVDSPPDTAIRAPPGE
jgi:DNA-binding response OmpR family regulator